MGTQQVQSNEHQHDRVKMAFKNLLHPCGLDSVYAHWKPETKIKQENSSVLLFTSPAICDDSGSL